MPPPPPPPRGSQAPAPTLPPQVGGAHTAARAPAITVLEAAAAGNDAEALKAALDAFPQKAMKLGQAVYEAQQAEQQAPPAGEAQGESSDDEPVDADFEVKS